MYRKATVEHYANHHKADGWIATPESEEQISDALTWALSRGLRVCLLGAQNSFSSIFLAEGQLHISMLKMNRVIQFDPANAEITVQSGVRICDVLRRIVPAGYYLTGLSGSYTDTIGGMVSSNCHGKDSWKYGNFGSNIFQLKLMKADGSIISINEGDELMKSVIGGLGAIGIILEVKLKLRKLPSNIVIVSGRKMKIEELSANLACDAEYKYAWVDMNEDKRRAAIVRTACFDPVHNRDIDIPEPRSSVYGVAPSLFWGAVHMVWNPTTYRSVNYFINLKYSNNSSYITAILKYLYPMLQYPGIKYANKHASFYELQCIFPYHTFGQGTDQIRGLMAKYRIYSMISGVKWHKADNIYLSFSGDGLSLSNSFGAEILSTRAGSTFIDEYKQIVSDYQGKFYLSKFSYQDQDQIRSSYPDIDKWKNTKEIMDPNSFFASDRVLQILGYGKKQ